MANSTRATKPAKPYPGFPLFPHANGRWAKKIRGKLKYFGKWESDPNGAAAELLYQEQREDLHAGRTPRVNRDGLTVKGLCDRFCTVKEDQSGAGDITRRSFLDYHRTCAEIVAAFGKTRLVDDLAADDFEAFRAALAKRFSPGTLGNEVQRVRVCFKYAYDVGLIDKPMRFGPTFKRPAKRILRAERQRKGSRLFEARHLRRAIKAADLPLRAMILLGVNCGFGNTDCGRLPMSALDLDGGWLTFPRPKTSIDRRCPLWPETAAALRDAIERRREPKDSAHDHLVFITKYGGPWAKDSPHSPVSGEMRKLLDRIDVYREGLGFYALRHTFETIAGGCRDQVAVDLIMGHADPTMAANYRQHVDDSRLVDAVGHVRRWLFRRDSADRWLSRRSKQK